jgi:acetyltransferase-like isoleucine patch superfamily enzyme
MLGELLLRMIEGVEWYLVGATTYYRRRGAKIGDQVMIRPTTSMAEPHLCEFGNNVRFAPNVLLLHHDGAMVMLYRAGRTDAVNVVGKIVIHDNVFVGAHSIIMGDVEIGPNAIVAAGSVVVKDVPPGTVVGGCPAKPISTLERYLEKYSQKENTLWVESDAQIRDEVVRVFMTEGRRGKLAIRLRRGKTPLICRTD